MGRELEMQHTMKASSHAQICRDPVFIHRAPGACPQRVIFLCCIIENSWGLSKEAPSRIQGLVHKFLVVRFLPSSFKGQGGGYKVLLGELWLESGHVFCQIYSDRKGD